MAKKSTELIEKFKAQRSISIIWFICSFVIILLFVIFTITNRFEDNTNEAWQWLLQQLIPTLTLIIGVFVNSTQESMNNKMIRKFYFSLSYYLSVGYFFIFFLTIFAMPFVYNFSGISGYAFLKQSTLYLIPLLGLTTASFGFFFSKD